MGQSALIKWLRVDRTWGTKEIHLMDVGGMFHSHRFLVRKEDNFGSFGEAVDKD